jgi:hypothetical protein
MMNDAIQVIRPVVLNGPISVLVPLTCTLLMVGAPGSCAGIGVLCRQEPLARIWVTATFHRLATSRLTGDRGAA